MYTPALWNEDRPPVPNPKMNVYQSIITCRCASLPYPDSRFAVCESGSLWPIKKGQPPVEYYYQSLKIVEDTLYSNTPFPHWKNSGLQSIQMKEDYVWCYKIAYLHACKFCKVNALSLSVLSMASYLCFSAYMQSIFTCSYRSY